MIKYIQKFIERFKYGYKIAEDCYLSALSKDELVVLSGNHKVKIYMERLKGKPDRVLYLDEKRKWLPPHENESITEEQYQFIINAVAKHFEELGEEVKVE